MECVELVFEDRYFLSQSDVGVLEVGHDNGEAEEDDEEKTADDDE